MAPATRPTRTATLLRFAEMSSRPPAHVLPTPPTPVPAPAPAQMTADEGLTLVRAENSSGFWGVTLGSNVSKPFQATFKHRGRTKNLGVFATAEEAALAVARGSPRR